MIFEESPTIRVTYTMSSQRNQLYSQLPLKLWSIETLSSDRMGPRYCQADNTINCITLPLRHFFVTAVSAAIPGMPICCQQGPRISAQCTDQVQLTLWRLNFLLNFSTPCIQNVNNTGTKQGSIMK
jgi:hypothetical protein